MFTLTIATGATFALLCLLRFWLSRRGRFRKLSAPGRVAKLAPRGFQLFYSDQKGGEKAEGVIYGAILSSDRHGICGKPDYVFGRARGGYDELYPVELKSGEIGTADAPHPGDLMQLAAYFVILEEMFDARVHKGRLVYKDCSFEIVNTRRLRNDLRELTAEMRLMLATGRHDVSPSFALCRYCVCRGTVCRYCGETPAYQDLAGGQ